MATILAKTLREKTSQELGDQMALEKKRLFDGIVKGASGEAIKAHEKRQGKRLIARIQGILRERDLRAELDKKITELTPKAEKASKDLKKRVKDVETRAAEIAEALKKPAGERKVKPQLKRLRFRQDEGFTVADRAADRLAEAKRVRAGLERTDIGQTR